MGGSPQQQQQKSAVPTTPVAAVTAPPTAGLQFNKAALAAPQQSMAPALAAQGIPSQQAYANQLLNQQQMGQGR